MAHRDAWRAKVGLALILCFALLSQAQLLRQAVATYRVSDEVGEHEARFRRLRGGLPSHGVVGYVSDARREPQGPEGARYIKQYFMTQYVLSPVLVADSTSADLVVGNFFLGRSLAGRTFPGLEVAEDFGDGVVLFRRAGR